MNHKLQLAILSGILLVAVALRITRLSDNPKGFFCDEASIGYNAYSILTTGKDEYGKSFPLFFRAFGEYKSPLDIYVTVPFVYFFGLREESVRMVSIIFCFGAALLLMAVGKAQKKPMLGIFSSIFFFFSPWSLHISKTNMEGMFILVFLMALFLVIQSTALSLKKQWIITAVITGIATYSYFPARIIMPLYMGIFGLFTGIKIKSLKVVLVGFLVYGLLCIPLGIHMLGPGMNRWKLVSAFSSSSQPPIHKIVQSYILHFSPDFLFFKGDAGMEGQYITRHSVKGIGELYVWQAIFILLGIGFLIRTRKSPLSFSLIVLLLLYPIPSSITKDISPQATRSISGLIPFCVLSGLGAYLVYVWLTKYHIVLRRMYGIALAIAICISVGLYLRLEQKYPSYASDYWGWQYGPKEIIAYFLTQNDSYDELYMTGLFNEPYIFYKFYDPSHRCVNCFIGGIHDYNPLKRQLFAFRTSEIPNELQGHTLNEKKYIYLPNGAVEYVIGEIIPGGAQ